jgi:hypothetical protein
VGVLCTWRSLILARAQAHTGLAGPWLEVVIPPMYPLVVRKKRRTVSPTPLSDSFDPLRLSLSETHPEATMGTPKRVPLTCCMATW